ncbi:efflux RND transporter permease subunit [Paenibacillus sp. LHD-38]|uniref:MMPL family transporter n=1 Tax=Paenibacillus sp. LHD-38 TaxID=3072143 RepID=UPI00280F7142|nr:efflux RND transporter permease subunit [Paenibacillus sp. LHD-38]MDQ8734384.1 efflux RND transporter permease subunit [Paenibacillus sp. LHD-38]
MGMHRLALLSFRFPKVIIFIWAAVLLFMGTYALKLDAVVQDHGLYPQGGSYAQVQQVLAADFNIPNAPVLLLFEKENGISKSRFLRFIEQALLRVEGLEGLKELVSPLEQRGMLEENHAYALLSFSYPAYRMNAVLKQLEGRLPTYSGISIKITGKSVIQADVNEASHKDLAKAELVGIPLAFLVLWFVFRRIATALLPIAIGVTGVPIAMGLLYGMGTKLALSNFVLNVIPMVGLALSIDFAIMLVSRFRSELQGNAVPVEALTVTMKTAGRAVFVSAASVLLGLLSFIWIPLPMFSSIALSAMTVVAVSLLLAFSLLPALFAVSLPALYKVNRSKRKSIQIGFWERVARFVMKRPAVTGLFAGGLLMLCLLPLSSMKVSIPDETSLPQSYDSRLAAEAYAAIFEQPSHSRVWVVVEGNAMFLKQSDWTEAFALTERFQRDPEVLKVNSVFSELKLSPEQLSTIVQRPLQKWKYEAELQPFLSGNLLLMQVVLADEPSSDAAMKWVREWEQRAPSLPLDFTLGGEAKYQQEVNDLVFGSLGNVLLFLLLSNFIVLFFAFRSVLIAVKTILLNLLSIGASFGILSWIFTNGRWGMEPSSIAIMIPVFIFGLVFGISMDYGVFLFSRIREEYDRTGSNEQAVRKGLASVSSIITAAAAIMIAVTAPFAFGEVVGVKQLGIGIAAAIFIDATIVRMVLVPSLMMLLGKWNWWAPRWLK